MGNAQQIAVVQQLGHGYYRSCSIYAAIAIADPAFPIQPEPTTTTWNLDDSFRLNDNAIDGDQLGIITRPGSDIPVLYSLITRYSLL